MNALMLYECQVLGGRLIYTDNRSKGGCAVELLDVGGLQDKGGLQHGRPPPRCLTQLRPRPKSSTATKICETSEPVFDLDWTDVTPIDTITVDYAEIKSSKSPRDLLVYSGLSEPILATRAPLNARNFRMFLI